MGMGILNEGGEYGANINPEDYDADYLDNTTQADVDAATKKGTGGIFLGDFEAGFKMGSVAGPIGSLVGAIAGAITGIIDADLSKDVLHARLTEEKELREQLEAELEDIMDMRNEAVRHLESMLHPLEQAFRSRARAFGAQARAQGLTGAQAIAAQLQAENAYREQIGPALPGLMIAASQSARQDAMLELRGLEDKYGINLQRQQQQFQQDLIMGQLKGQALGGLTSTLTQLGGLFGDLLIEEGKSNPQGAGKFGNTVTGGAGGAGGGAFTSDPRQSNTTSSLASGNEGMAGKAGNESLLSDQTLG